MPSRQTVEDNATKQIKRTCFVTIGATAAFEGLVRAVLRPDFLQALKRHHYTDLVVQFGAGGDDLFESCQAQARSVSPDVDSSTLFGIKIEGFPVDTNGLDLYMKRAKAGKDSESREGCIISHAGTGTILSAMRLAIPIIVVPNEELLDNHQVELAEVLAQQGYVIHGRSDALAQALDELEEVRHKVQSWPPVNSGAHRKSNTIKQVLDEEMGFLD
ncbi:glycosyltransferase family 28 C-terminal domain-containing protein [Elsinoe ampelina]|uniref:UDP-N-acetylglucosamine transferase subunit ALG13 n=1 Tax=Elsinoe ampelina TaxID=302913 RepID=A0A6A6GE13_9PEZI|nr:glycosyltransferase family 28 C-terminal domain-containing protein [Elsinoe ampelina]